MGKKLVIVGFLLSLALGLYVFVTRDTKSLKENLSKGSIRDPRARLEDLLKAKLKARVGDFYEPNVVQLDGEIRGERLTPAGERETLGAESVTAYFKSTSLTKMLDQSSELDRAELTGFVEVGMKEHLLTTDYAEYVNSEKVVRSVRPVRVEGPGRVFMGDEGFTYELANQVLNMIGQIKGEVLVEEHN